MSITGIDNTTAASGLGAIGTQTPQALPVSASKGLGQDAFLKLLVAQLQNQDPTKPKDDTEFITQLATFSQLEKLTSIDASLKALTTQVAALTPAAPASSSASTTPSSGTVAAGPINNS